MTLPTAAPEASGAGLQGWTEPVQVHFDDLDAMGMVHNARYPLLLERALMTYWTAHGWSSDPGRSAFEDVFLAVREFTITYHVPIAAAGTIGVRFWIDRLGNTSVVYGFQVLSADGATVHAEGRRAQVRIDPATLRPQPLSERLRELARPLVRTAA
ncbi:acyl-CoA thioesterase [Allonocardiopsis opalescens]|uniref:Acyl-CoA thioester hydrolase n=1 Tax=Allonocardiopsis opalescens TaxID=1144618 RepID=A0A2T0PXT5_9ACTN|nr:thioesterase family protein [Allonocardiopsis opalescens]PRX96319.1 acyl-CoA thioester hydrolase [Allonocardiopsis opalescens]